VTGCPGIRFYAGAVIQDADGFYRSLCVIDTSQEHFLINRKCIKIVGKSSCFIVGSAKKKCTVLANTQLEFKHFIELSKI
jgi:hypothetical protein